MMLMEAILSPIEFSEEAPLISGRLPYSVAMFFWKKSLDLFLVSMLGEPAGT